MLDGNFAEHTPKKEEEKTMRVYRSTNLSPVFLSIFIVAICMFGVSAASIQAATYTVTNTNDNGAGSLRQAIIDANAAAGADTIDFDTAGVFATPQTITLGGTELTISDDLMISGTGAGKLTISGNNASRVFYIASGKTVTLDAMTVTGGTGVGIALRFGGAVYNDEGILTITNSLVSGNSALAGGGIYNNSAGELSVYRSTISDNNANQGGGIYNGPTGAVNVNNSTISGNHSNGSGGGITNFETLTINNSTICDNYAGVWGGGVWNSSTLDLNGSIVANNTSPNGPDIRFEVTTGDYNLIGNTSGITTLLGTHTITGVNPLLGSIADNGGPTKTHAILPGSPAIDKGTNSGALSNDQRGAGFARTINDPNVADAADGDGTDIGAVESNYLTVNTTAQDNDGACQPLPGGDCTLREAILAANAAPGTETIVFDIPTTDPGYDSVADRYTITLTEELPYLNSDMFINGLGAKRLTVRRDAAAAAFPVFRIDEVNKTVTISGMTITGGAGGTGDVSTSGGIHNFGTLTVIDSTLSGNTASAGGAVINFGTMTMINSTVSGNSANFHGGGIFNIATLTLINSTVSNNSAVINGGGIMNVGEMWVINSTVADNSAIRAGGIYSSGSFSSMELDGSIIADNTATFNGNDLLGGVTAGDYNLIGGILNVDFVLPAGSTHNIINVDPKLGPLADNGGPTMTHTLLCGSPAIDAGVAYALATDQRGTGFVRKFDDSAVANAAGGDGTDIGAFELQAPLVCNTAPVANGDGYTINEDPASPLTGNVLSNDTDGESDTLTAALVGSAPSGLTFNTDGSFSYTPASNFNGIVQFTYKANDGSLDSNVATVTITVNPVNDAPVVSATPQIQLGVQYSDAITTINISASDVETPAANLSIVFTYSKDGGAYQPGLPTGMVQGGTGGAWTISGVAGVEQGAYAIRSRVTDTGDGSAAPTIGGLILAIEVTRENAVAAPKASNPVSMQVGSGGSASGTTAPICFDITEPSDGSPGDTSLINSATVQIAAVGGGGVSGVTASARTFSGGGVGGTRTACFTLNFAGVVPNVFEVTLVIGGDFYTGSGTTVFTVFDPSSGFVSGGGWIINPNNGYRANYGVNIKYLKSGSAQGSLLYIEHRPNGDYKVKSTSLNSRGGFAIIPIIGGAEADIAGKANYVVNDVGTGNYSFIARVIDKGTPGTNDQFGLKLIDPLGQVVTGFTFNPVTLGGGNNQVPKK